MSCVLDIHASGLLRNLARPRAPHTWASASVSSFCLLDLLLFDLLFESFEDDLLLLFESLDDDLLLLFESLELLLLSFDDLLFLCSESLAMTSPSDDDFLQRATQKNTRQSSATRLLPGVDTRARVSLSQMPNEVLDEECHTMSNCQSATQRGGCGGAGQTHSRVMMVHGEQVLSVSHEKNTLKHVHIGGWLPSGWQPVSPSPQYGDALAKPARSVAAAVTIDELTAAVIGKRLCPLRGALFRFFVSHITDHSQRLALAPAPPPSWPPLYHSWSRSTPCRDRAQSSWALGWTQALKVGWL